MTESHDAKAAGSGSGRHFRRSAHGVWVGLGAALVLAAMVAGAAARGRGAEDSSALGRLGHGEWRGGHGEALLSGALRWVGADEEQRARALAISESAHEELEPLMVQHREQAQAFREALLAPEVDRAALEELRIRELALADQASQLLLQSIADLGDVLTPEQRRELASLASHGHRWAH